MDLNALVDNLKLNGFVNIGPLPLNSQERDELIKLTMDVSEGMSPDHPDYLAEEKHGFAGVRCLPQHHPRVAELLNLIFSDPHIQSVLKSVLGPDYKIWQLNFRRSMPGDKGLCLHQDAPGEFAMGILHSRSEKGEGATVFLPGSHLVPTTMKEWKLEVPPGLLMKMRDLCSPLTGEAGDVAFFFNRTWHGRFSNTSNNSNDCILLSFFPAGTTLGYENCGEWSPKFLSEIQGTELARLIDPSIGTEKLDNGHFKILSSGNADDNVDLPYLLSIETPQGQKQGLTNFNLKAKILFMRMVWGIIKLVLPLYRLIKKMTGVGVK
jgi:non-haem Fe2+, alpha-ketoglutarate-dependent halogenase